MTYNDPIVTLACIIINTVTITTIQYINDKKITNTICPIVHLFISIHSGESNDRVKPFSQLPQAIPDLCGLHCFALTG